MISLSNLPFVPECLPRQSVLSKFSFGVILLLVTLWKRALLYALHVTESVGAQKLESLGV